MSIEEELLSLAERRRALRERAGIASDDSPFVVVSSAEDAEALQAESDEIDRRERELLGGQK